MGRREFGSTVALRLSDEQGVVTGYAEYADSAPQYRVMYLCATGEQKTGWFYEAELKA